MLPRVSKHVLLPDSKILLLHLLLLLVIHKLERELENLRKQGALEHLETALNRLVMKLLPMALEGQDRVLRVLVHHHGGARLVDA